MLALPHTPPFNVVILSRETSAFNFVFSHATPLMHGRNRFPQNLVAKFTSTATMGTNNLYISKVYYYCIFHVSRSFFFSCNYWNLGPQVSNTIGARKNVTTARSNLADPTLQLTNQCHPTNADHFQDIGFEGTIYLLSNESKVQKSYM